MAELEREADRKPWRLPWRTVRRGTQHEASDVRHNNNVAEEVFCGVRLDDVMAAALSADDWQDRAARFIEITDDLIVALDQLGWRLVPKDPSSEDRWPMAAHHDLCPDWCASAEEWDSRFDGQGEGPKRRTLRLVPNIDDR
jgi:hypothetical protein